MCLSIIIIIIENKEKNYIRLIQNRKMFSFAPFLINDTSVFWIISMLLDNLIEPVQSLLLEIVDVVAS